ncbi:MAG TPA: hypothetical protein VHL10_00755 [Nitrososphaera sp.]|jgi:predicted nuclease with TOPRIM domain|nr:hypothetical protein [Nitrososphaera sp.]
MSNDDIAQLKAIIEMVTAPLQQQFAHTLAGQEELRRMFDGINTNQTRLEERVKMAEDDVAALSKQIDDLKETILNEQREKFKEQKDNLKKVIGTQAALLILVAGAIISTMIPVLLQIFKH